MPPDEDDSNGEEGGVLSPDELDITDDENVVEIDEGRYVISAGGGPPSATPNPSSQADRSGGEPAGESRDVPSADAEETTELSDESVHDWLEASVGDARSQYGFDVTAKFEGSVTQQELFSNDVSTTFENLVVWYAQHVGGDTPVEEVLGILLMEANVSVHYPTKTVRALVSEQGLTPEDSIADLLEALEDRDRVSFPP